MKEWFEQSFGKDYMIVYRHRDEEQAKREVHAMIDWLDVQQAANLPLLDVGCGSGRHSITLDKRGFQVTGFDLSEVLLSEAKKEDKQQRISWVQGDMRKMPFARNSFTVTVNLFTSFGYFESLAENEKVIANIADVLKQEGQFIIDFLNPLYVRDNYIPYNKRIDEESKCIIEEFRALKNTVIEKKITITANNGEVRQYKEQVAMLPLLWFQYCFEKYNLQLEQLYGHYDGRSFEECTPRMIMVGRKLRS